MHNVERFASEKSPWSMSRQAPFRCRKNLTNYMNIHLAFDTTRGNIGSVRQLYFKYRHILVWCLLIVFLPLHALYSYNPTEDLKADYWESTDTTIYDATTFGIQSAGFAVACSVGTLHIERVSNNHVMLGLRLQRSGKWNNGNEYTLVSTESINYQRQFGAQIVAKITRGSQPAIIQLINWSSGQDVFVNPQALLEAPDLPLHVEFFLGIRNIQNAQQTQGVGFQFQGVGGHNLGNFQVISRRRVPINPWNYSFYNEAVPINLTSDPVPFYSVNYNKGSSSYINGAGGDRRVFASLSIEEVDPSGRFDLLQLINTPTLPIATARLTLSGYQSTNSDVQGSSFPSFAMKHEDVKAYIPFELFLDANPISKGVPIEWNDLVYGSSNTRALSVGGISLSDAENQVSGLYSDTIIVQVTPLDTNVVVQ
jgi:hypothetical protein